MTLRWAKVAVALVAAALLGWSALANALVNVTHTRNPAFALRLAADDPVALVRNAEASVAADRGAVGSARVTAALKNSLRKQALNPRAFQLLGFEMESGGTSARVSTLLTFSNRLSRRDLSTQLWLIEEAVRRNDIARVLEHYDIALRSRPSSEALLFPVLTRAMDEPIIRRRFLRYMHSRPPWLQAFLRTAVTTSSNPKAIADLVVETGGLPQSPEYQTFNGQLIRSLAYNGDYVGAHDFYRRLPGTDANVARTAAMTAATTDPRYAPITWQLYELDGIDASFAASSKNSVQIVAQLDTIYVGSVAQKLLRLAPGMYSFVARHEAPNAAQLSQITWNVKCVGNSSSVLFNHMSDLMGTSQTTGTFTVPASCPMQTLSADGRAGVETGTLELTIGPVTVTRR